jgi:hypothetical protein
LGGLADGHRADVGDGVRHTGASQKAIEFAGALHEPLQFGGLIAVAPGEPVAHRRQIDAEPADGERNQSRPRTAFGIRRSDSRSPSASVTRVFPTPAVPVSSSPATDEPTQNGRKSSNAGSETWSGSRMATQRGTSSAAGSWPTCQCVPSANAPGIAVQPRLRS